MQPLTTDVPTAAGSHAGPLAYAAPAGRPRPHRVWLACGIPLAAFSAFLAVITWEQVFRAFSSPGPVSFVIGVSPIGYLFPAAAIALSAVGYRRSRVLAILTCTVAVLALLAFVLSAVRRPNHII